MRIIDCHTHINSGFFQGDFQEVLERTFKAEVAIVNIGTKPKDSEENVRLAEKYPGKVFAAVGLHPVEPELFDYDFYKRLAERQEVVAIGECGLDYYREANQTKEDKDRQRRVFHDQIRLAREVKKPLMLHLRTQEAYEEAIDILEKEKGLAGIIFHFFVGSREQAKRILAFETEVYFNFGGVITFARDYDEVLKMIPRERILLETDAPFLAPEPHRGRRNEPIFILETAKKAAEILGIELDELLEQEKRNAERAFKISLK